MVDFSNGGTESCHIIRDLVNYVLLWQKNLCILLQQTCMYIFTYYEIVYFHITTLKQEIFCLYSF